MHSWNRNFYLTLLILALTSASALPGALPVRGLHLMVPAPEDVGTLAGFIQRDLPGLGVNTLVLEVNYRFEFDSHPELAQRNALSAEDVASLVAASSRAGIQLIPQFNCLGHQSWAENTFPLLTVHPEFDETPGRYPNNEGIYCRSYCPRHPEVHGVVLALIDELVNAFQAKAFHVGMDEVFLLGEDDCVRCRGADPALLFADEVTLLRNHLASRQVEMWMWGDRFIDGKTSGIGKWEASENGTQPSLYRIPKDVVICDWHYEAAPPTPGYFALNGFRVLASPWRKPDVALGQLEQIELLRRTSGEVISERLLGVLQTTWTNPIAFIRAFRGEQEGVPDSAREAAACFKALFTALPR